MLEASVRAVEGGVLSSSELDKQVQVRVSELTMDTSAAVGNSTEAVERLNTLSQKFKDLRASASKAFLAKHKTPFHDASMLEARLVVSILFYPPLPRKKNRHFGTNFIAYNAIYRCELQKRSQTRTVVRFSLALTIAKKFLET